MTIVLNAMENLPTAVTSVDRVGIPTVAVRVPKNALAQAIIDAAGGALAVTSANRSGAPPATDASQIERKPPYAPDAIIDGGRAPGGQASTIVRVMPDSVVILRDGPISATEIDKALQAEPQRGRRLVRSIRV